MADSTSLAALWENLAHRYSDRLAVRFEGQDWTYEELFTLGERIAAALIRHGLEKGERVCIWMPNRTEWLAIDVGIARAGGVMVPLNTRYTADEVEYILRFAGVHTLFIVDRFYKIDYSEMLLKICPELAQAQPGHLDSARLPNLKNIVCLGMNKPKGVFSFDEFTALSRDSSLDRALADRRRSIKPEDPAKIFFTSGTTSFPKGAVLCQHLWKNMQAIADRIQIQPEDRLLMATPMFYILGNLQLVLAPLLKGASVHPVERFDPTLIFSTIERDRCTILDGVPTMFQSLLESRDLSRYDLSSLRTGRVGGAPISLTLINDIIHRLHIPELHAMYGLTECTGVSMATHKGDPPEVLAASVGTPLPGTATRIVDPKTGQDLPRGQSGELWIKGDMVTIGYYHQPEETARVLTEGWFHTGDLMRHGADGYFEFIGRSKDLIKRGGENVSPPEVEACIFRHPAVDHVEVVGVPDEKYGEVGVAFIKTKEGVEASESEILNFCKKHLARFKIPARVLFVKRFPQTATGKIQKFKLREQATKDLMNRKGE